MTMFDPARAAGRLASPGGPLAFGVAVAAAFMLVPPEAVAPLKQTVAASLRPAQDAVARATDWCRAQSAAWEDRAADAKRLGDLEQQLAATRRTGKRLRGELELALTREKSADEAFHIASRPTDPLLVTELVEARVLGRQARAFLWRRDLLSVGERSGVVPGAWVVEEGPEMIDLGQDAEVEAGRLVLAGRRVWGKIVEVGPWTSSVRPIHEEGYRDLVQFASAQADRLQFGARGVLMGTGERLCRIRLVEAVEPISVGDRVYTAGGEGVLDAPLLYGTVVRAEVPPGAAHWEIWMQPAVFEDPVGRVSVLRTDLNQLRMEEGE